jgi:hypothetical protein
MNEKVCEVGVAAVDTAKLATLGKESYANLQTGDRSLRRSTISRL